MASGSFRFLHAGDFHLESVPTGLLDIPSALRQSLRDASLAAVERVFAVALAERVDFVTLAGDLVDCRVTGLQEPLFLCEQFRRLAEREISVYWATGAVDAAEHWPAACALPEAVRIFSTDRTEKTFFARDGRPVAQLVGRSRRGKATPPELLADRHPELPTIAVAHGDYSREALQTHVIDYWALGGSHQPRTVSEQRPLAQYAGAPVGRSPEELGAHGCWLVDYEADRGMRARFVPCDPLRYVQDRFEVGEHWDTGRLEKELRGRLKNLADTAEGRDLLVSVSLRGAPRALLPWARDEQRLREMATRLGQESAKRRPAALPLAIEVEPQALFADEHLQTSGFLGDFLQKIADQAESEAAALDWESLLGEVHPGRERPTLCGQHPAERERLLRYAAALGVAWLSGEGMKSS